MRLHTVSPRSHWQHRLPVYSSSHSCAHSTPLYCFYETSSGIFWKHPCVRIPAHSSIVCCLCFCSRSIHEAASLTMLCCMLTVKMCSLKMCNVLTFIVKYNYQRKEFLCLWIFSSLRWKLYLFIRFEKPVFYFSMCEVSLSHCQASSIPQQVDYWDKVFCFIAFYDV